jgi:glucose-1-phosphate thymidylyltransferase
LKNINEKYIGLIPAAGHATRLKLDSGSKEIYPIAFEDGNGEKVTYPVCKCLLDTFSGAGVKNVCVITRKEKKDIEKKLSTGKEYAVSLDYLYCNDTYGPPYTLDRAYQIVKDKYFVALGFPDILIKPKSALTAIIQKQEKTEADVVLALFETDIPKKMDMVVFDVDGKIHDLDIKPSSTTLKWTWALAVWSPKFSRYMHHCLKKLLIEYETNRRTECHVGTVFQIALKDGIKFDHVFIHDGEMIDIGTPEDLIKIKKSSRMWFK